MITGYIINIPNKKYNYDDMGTRPVLDLLPDIQSLRSLPDEKLRILLGHDKEKSTVQFSAS